MCGGTRRRCCRRQAPAGLSPRVRGNRTAIRRPPLMSGSIPACAGEPAPGGISAHPGLVYPRVCGGTHIQGQHDSIAKGLSPRVRGNPPQPMPPAPVPGSIPACAGEPTITAGDLAARTVYPRVCGGTVHIDGHHRNANGLSPRVRGNPITVGDAGAGSGSIPACAGEPLPTAVAARNRAVYPRVCGGTFRQGLAVATGGGLSPRVRGNLRGNAP